MTEILHIGDNLEFMKSLQSESIDLIYGDILYGTGRDFGDYKDIKADRKTVEAFYIPRITEMHRLLKNTGSIYLQMDSKINHYVRLILEDVFGYQNFKSEISVKRFSQSMNKTMRIKNFNSIKDVILYFTKTDNYVFNIQYTPLSNETLKKYDKFDDGGRFAWMCLSSYSEETYNNLKAQNRLKEAEHRKHPRYKIYLHESKGNPLTDFFDDIEFLSSNNSEKIDYQTQKPIELMARIIKASSNEGDVCADFFAGSGSFGVAAKKLNRNIILCDINPKAIELSKKRLQSETNLFNCSGT